MNDIDWLLEDPGTSLGITVDIVGKEKEEKEED